mmetsp:Transcript_55146/g.139795  ORF Transcript_55146/g.139795 Transcript_55146/m.139795 type:complete len:91 (+) Transcript_55146:104-376(+)
MCVRRTLLWHSSSLQAKKTFLGVFLLVAVCVGVVFFLKFVLLAFVVFRGVPSPFQREFGASGAWARYTRSPSVLSLVGPFRGQVGHGCMM